MDSPIPRWLRVFLVIVAAQAFLLVPALINPGLINIVQPWPATPLNARFIAALYTGLGIGVLLSLRARVFREVRLVVIGIGLATAILLVITLYRLQAFGMDELALRQFPTMWTLFYIIDPLVVIYTLRRIPNPSSTSAGRHPLAALWLAQAILLGSLGLVLLALPDLAISLWPWALTAPLSQLYSGHFLTLAMISALASRESRWEGMSILAWIFVVLALLIIMVSLVHLDRFKPGLPTLVWFGLLGLEALGFGAVLWNRRFYA